MPETGLGEGLLDLIDQRADGRRVTGFRLRVGIRHSVVQAAFDQAVTMVADGTLAHGASVELVLTPSTVTCRQCRHRGESADPRPVCSRCGAVEVDVTGGDDLVLESLRFEPA